MVCLALAIPAAGPAKQQLPISGCSAAISCSTPRGFATGLRPGTAVVWSSRSGFDPRRPRSDGDRDVVLPPMPDLKDSGAIDAAILLVQTKNPRFRETLRVARARLRPERPDAGSGDEIEIHIRVKPAAVIDFHRIDVPEDRFAAMPLRPAVYPQFRPRPR